MTDLQPTYTTCYQLTPPTLPKGSEKNLDEAARKRLSLDCRTGAAISIARSSIFVHGGLTIPLNLSKVNSVSLQKELILYFAKIKDSSSSFKNLNDWISSEIFYLDLITRAWQRIEIETSSENFQERLFHSMCSDGSNIYIFGGLMVSPQNDYELIATNELWKLDLLTKKWTLMSKDPLIARRFDHSIFTLHTDEESKDTKLVVVGGLNNMDQPVNYIDIYNLSKNEWESLPNTNKIITNIAGKPVSITHDQNRPILIENNEADIPTLTYYVTDNTNNNPLDDSNADGQENLVSPIIALPLVPDSQGIRINPNFTQTKDCLQIPFNLQYPNGDYVDRNLVLAGFYPTCKPSNLHCFVYDISLCKWTEISLSCDHKDLHQHRFWKLFIWNSHRQALVLGSLDDDGYLPSVQKFDFLLVFALPMLNSFNNIKMSMNVQNNPVLFTHNNSNSISNDPSLPMSIPTTPIERTHTSLPNPNNVPNSTSKFENYIKYITRPLELESSTSVFPPHAMVLGKDALEIYGKPLSDFELITSEGDSIGVPSYLLRKRWGRYFDFLISEGYARVCQEYEKQETKSTLIKFSPNTSMNQKIPSKDQPFAASSSASLDAYFNNNKGAGNTDSRKLRVNYSTSPKNSTTNIQRDHPFISSKRSPTNSQYNLLHINNSEDDIGTETNNRYGTNLYEDFKTMNSKANMEKNLLNSTTSSSTGMVFRVPFQESHHSTATSTSRKHKGKIKKQHDAGTIHVNKRRSFLITNQMSNLNKLTNPMEDIGKGNRRASHPAHLFSDIGQITPPNRRSSLRGASRTNNNSRKASFHNISK